MPFDVKPLPGGIGTEVLGLRLDGPVAADTAAALREVWLDTGIVLFRGIGTSPEALLALSRCFGELEIHPIERFRLPGYPELILLTNKDGPSGPVYDFDGERIHGRIPWHTDLAFTTTPNAGALLRMVQKTATGGETGWLDTARAYDELDETTKQRIDGLEAVYHFSSDLDEMRFNRPGGGRRPDRAAGESQPPSSRVNRRGACMRFMWALRVSTCGLSGTGESLLSADLRKFSPVAQVRIHAARSRPAASGIRGSCRETGTARGPRHCGSSCGSRRSPMSSAQNAL